jgi:hypothetical protein
MLYQTAGHGRNSGRVAQSSEDRNFGSAPMNVVKFIAMRPTLIAVALVALGVSLFVGGAVMPWREGNPVPYAPGDDASSARSAARTAQGYTRWNVTVYEGEVSASRPEVAAVSGPTGNFWISLRSGSPEIYFQDLSGTHGQSLPKLVNGEVVRIWTTIGSGPDEIVDGAVVPTGETRYAWRVEAPGLRWVAPGTTQASIPLSFEGGSSPPMTAIHFGGIPGGLLLGLGGLVLLYRRAVGASSKPWRRVDHVAIWGPITAVLVGAMWVQSVRGNGVVEALPVLFLAVLPLLVGLVAGIIGLATRKSERRWWPSVIGIVTGGGMLVLAVIIGVTILSNLCGFIYC